MLCFTWPCSIATATTFPSTIFGSCGFSPPFLLRSSPTRLRTFWPSAPRRPLAMHWKKWRFLYIDWMLTYRTFILYKNFSKQLLYTKVKFTALPGQFWSLQDCLPVLLPLHPFPPCLAVVASVLRLSWVPPPQDLVHFDHWPQLDHSQCTEKMYYVIFLYFDCITYYTKVNLSYQDIFHYYKIVLLCDCQYICLHHVWHRLFHSCFFLVILLHKT